MLKYYKNIQLIERQISLLISILNIVSTIWILIEFEVVKTHTKFTQKLVS